MTKYVGNAARIYELSVAMKKRGIRPTTHEKGTAEWFAWLGWRKRNGFSNTYMETVPRYGFPSDMPPEGSLDTALDEMKAGTASKRFAT